MRNIKDEALGQLFAIARNKGEIDDSLRLKVAHYVAFFNDDPIEKDKALEILINLAKDQQVDPTVRLEAREDIYSKGIAYLLKEEGLKKVLKRLSPEDYRFFFLPQEKIERAQWLLAQYDDSLNYDWHRNHIRWTIKQLEESQASNGRGGLIVELNQ